MEDDYFLQQPQVSSRIQSIHSADSSLKSPENEYYFGSNEAEAKPILVPVAVYDGQPSFPLPSHEPPNSTIRDGEGQYMCYQCNKRFDKPRSLAAHSRLHSGTKAYTCLLCGRSFKQPSSLVMHTKTMHMKSEYLQCGKCNKSFKKESSLENHMMLMHPESDEERPTSTTDPSSSCNEPCPVEDGGKANLDASLEYGEFTCDICFRTFEQKAQIEIHMRVHAPGGEHKFACHMCSKTFKTSSDLKRHLRVHTGERPYVCMFCNKGFGNSGNLKQHIRTHTGHCPYECKKCNKRFKRPNAVKHHLCSGEPDSESQAADGMHPAPIQFLPKRILPSQQVLHEEFDDQELMYAQPTTCPTIPPEDFRDGFFELHYPPYGQPIPKQVVTNNRSPKQSLSQVVTNLKANATMVKAEPVYYPVLVPGQNNIHQSAPPQFYNQVLPDNSSMPQHVSGRQLRSAKQRRQYTRRKYASSQTSSSDDEATSSSTYLYKAENEYPNKEYTSSNDAGFQCDVCHRMCKNLTEAVEHMSIHTGELPIGCKNCRKVFCKATSLAEHICTSTLTCPLKNFPLND